MARVELLQHVLDAVMVELPADMADGVSQGLRMMAAPVMWAAGWNGQGVPVGVIDTGIDSSHPDLAAAVVGRRDYVQDGAPMAAWHPHGTHVAGIVGGRGRLKGAAPGCQLRDYRVLDRAGRGASRVVTQAVRDAVSDGCRIINMSLGSPDDDPELHEAIRDAVAAGVTVIVSVGNEGAGRVSYPGYFPEVIGVGSVAIRPGGLILRSYFSNTNPEVDVCAPGEEIVSCSPGGGYIAMSGTSMAAPHVAGMAALLEQRGAARLSRPMSEQGRWESVKCSSVDVMLPGVDTSTGAGFVSALPAFPVTRRVQITGDSSIMRVDGAAVTLDVPAQIISGRFVTPFRALAEAAGAAVSWDEPTQTGTAEFLVVPGVEV